MRCGCEAGQGRLHPNCEGEEGGRVRRNGKSRMKKPDLTWATTRYLRPYVAPSSSRLQKRKHTIMK